MTSEHDLAVNVLAQHYKYLTTYIPVGESKAMTKDEAVAYLYKESSGDKSEIEFLDKYLDGVIKDCDS